MPLHLRTAGSALAGVPFAVAYGLLMRYLFGLPAATSAALLLTLGFLALVPLAIGALTVYLGRRDLRTRWAYALLMPLLAIVLFALVVVALAMETLICVLMAAPFMLALAPAGGALACALLRRAEQGGGLGGAIGLLLCAPLIVAPIESYLAESDAYATAETMVVIAADAQTVWEQLIAVPTIRPAERRFSPLFSLLGAPRPLAATLDRPGVGGLRTGYFEQNLVFVEQITTWEPGRRIVWSIDVGDRSHTPAPWGAIGGRSFDVTGASYWIEPIGDGRVILHLDSSYRLTTRFNRYGLLWTDWGLREFQSHVLNVLKGRAEAVGPRP